MRLRKLASGMRDFEAYRARCSNLTSEHSSPDAAVVLSPFTLARDATEDGTEQSFVLQPLTRVLARHETRRTPYKNHSNPQATYC